MLFKNRIKIAIITGASFAFPASATFIQPCINMACEKQKTSTKQVHIEVRTRILYQYFQWKGVKYKLGGLTGDGIDCSALMQEIFSDGLNETLPRTTAEQIRKGRSVNIGQLKPGDLVFFQIENESRHVGVYIGRNQFVHASKNQGVTVSSFESHYWIEHFEDARRVLS